jgi:salicylate hydroxylase
MKSGNLWALFDFPSTRTFYNNRVCIIGDAAPPSQGSGAAMAMEDALAMSRLLLKV